jgi:hypothetical protein
VHSTNPNFWLFRYWRGEGPLWKVFWLYGVLASNIGVALVAWGLVTARIGHGALAGLVVLLLAYTVWVLVSIWRCAGNVHYRYFGLLARALTVAWAVNALLVSGFLLLEL